MKNIMFIAPPAAGKGTQAELVVEKYHIPHISTGDILREIAKEDSEIGQYVFETLASGKLVKDEITYQLIEERLARDDCKNGYIIDGFPRNLAQAKELDKMVELDKAIMIHLDDEEIINRLSKRRMCKVCGNPTHMDWLVDNKCEKCGGDVYQRDDDAPATIKARLEKQKLPQDVIDFYKEKGIYEQITSTDTKEETFKLVDAILKTL